MRVKRKRKGGEGKETRLIVQACTIKNQNLVRTTYHLMETRYQLQSKSLITPKFFPEVLKGEYVFFLIRISNNMIHYLQVF